jgi:prepilin-type N-terminal cleavage/methylation domain-containing protein
MKKGVSLIELLISIIILSVAILSLLWLNSFSNRQTVDSYYRLLGLQIAQESMELCHALGFQQLSDGLKKDSHMPFSSLSDTWTTVAETEPGSPVLRRPMDVSLFQRRVIMKMIPESEGIRGIRVNVQVRQKQQGWLKGVMAQTFLDVDDLIMEPIP